MDTLISKNSWKRKLELGQISRSSSTLNIPSDLIMNFTILSKRFGGTRLFCTYLLRKYRILFHTGTLPGSNSTRNLYQKRGLKPEKISFRPTTEDWLELRLLSQSNFISMTAIFVYLLRLESSKFGGKFEKAMKGIPPTKLLSKPFRFNQTFNLLKNTYRMSAKSGSSIYIFFKKKRFRSDSE